MKCARTCGSCAHYSRKNKACQQDDIVETYERQLRSREVLSRYHGVPLFLRTPLNICGRSKRYWKHRYLNKETYCLAICFLSSVLALLLLSKF